MQQWHEEKQQSLLHLQEAVEACCAECVAQKARREAEAKAKKEAKKQRIVEKKKKLEYIQQLWDKMLKEETEESQIMGSKHKKVIARDEEGQQPSKKAKGKQQEKYYRGTTVKMGGANHYKRYMSTGQDCLVYPSR